MTTLFTSLSRAPGSTWTDATKRKAPQAAPAAGGVGPGVSLRDHPKELIMILKNADSKERVQFIGVAVHRGRVSTPYRFR